MNNKCTPRKIYGEWKDGFALDMQTLRSDFVGYDEFGNPRFDTTRTDIGELLYKLKYKNDKAVVTSIVNALEIVIKKWNPHIDIIVPVPSSTPRIEQPVMVLAKEISKRLNISLVDCIERTSEVPQLKNIFDHDERLRILNGLYQVNTSSIQDKNILLFDDLYRSGATMNAVTTALYEFGKVSNVFALAVTRTRSNS